MLLAPFLALPARGQVAPPNVVVFIADDLGVDRLQTYVADTPGFVPTANAMPVTPAIDTLVSSGVRFTNAWANPLCSPTRAMFLTGKHGYRTGVGEIIEPGSSTPDLAFSFVTLPEALRPTYTTGLFGKWHLGETGLDLDGNDDETDWFTLGTRLAIAPPAVQGFTEFDGYVNGGMVSYWNWTEVVSHYGGRPGGSERAEVLQSTTYGTQVIADRAISWMTTTPEPFLSVVSFGAPHKDGSGWSTQHGSEGCSTLTAPTNDLESARAMIECMDFHIDRILAALDGAGRLDDTVLFFFGDHGQGPAIGDPNFPRYDTAKSTAYEAGLRVPLVAVQGSHVDGTPYGTSYSGAPYVQGDTVNVGLAGSQLVGVVDLYDTILGLAGVTPGATDSIDVQAMLADPAVRLRPYLYAEKFDDDDADGVFAGKVGVRNDRFKLIVNQGDDGTATACQRTELYDLQNDRAESNDLSSDPAYGGVVATLRAHADAKVLAFESAPVYGDHWFWSQAQAPRTTGSCP